MVQYGRHLTKGKILHSANHVSQELTIRFAHRIRQMQLMPYRIMSHPALLDAYEQYVDSFEMLRRVGSIKTLHDNEELMRTGQRLLQKHTKVVTNIITALREIVKRPHKPEDDMLVNDLVKSLVTSRLSRRVLVQQHALLTESWRSHQTSSETRSNAIGEVVLDCRIVDVLSIVEARAKAHLSGAYQIDPKNMPPIVIEGLPEDLDATFPYIWTHYEFVLGELLYNSLEACIRQNVTEPIVVTVSATKDFVMVRLSDRGGGISSDQMKHVWSFAKSDGTDSGGDVTQQGLANHQFFSLLFPQEEVTDDQAEFTGPLYQGYEMLSPLPQDSYEHLGLGLALAKLYVEYWCGALELHSLEGFGCDAVLRVSRTGSKKENLRL